MSTNNYKFENILVILPDFNFYHDCESGNSCEGKNDCKQKGQYEDFDEFAYDEWVADVQSQLEKIRFEKCDKWDSQRNYSGKIIARYGLEDKDRMIVWLEVVVRAGYYSGANIDYMVDGDFGIENEQNKKQVAHYEAMHRKLDRQVEKTKKILRKNGTELLKVGQFSNGEAVYELKNKKTKK